MLRFASTMRSRSHRRSHAAARPTRARTQRDADAGYVPDVLLPTQMMARRYSPTAPVERLMLAVLEEAISTYQRRLVARSSRAERELDDVQQWIESDDTSWPFSCASICHVLGLDVTRLRRELRRWRDGTRRGVDANGRATPRYVTPFRRIAGSRSRITLRRGARPDVGRRPSWQAR
jgi:hypothetical protein